MLLPDINNPPPPHQPKGKEKHGRGLINRCAGVAGLATWVRPAGASGLLPAVLVVQSSGIISPNKTAKENRTFFIFQGPSLLPYEGLHITVTANYPLTRCRKFLPPCFDTVNELDQIPDDYFHLVNFISRRFSIGCRYSDTSYRLFCHAPSVPGKLGNTRPGFLRNSRGNGKVFMAE